MCRVLSYLGQPILVEDLLYNPDNSFIKQTYNPKLMSKTLNLAGFGFSAWGADSPNNKPHIYRTCTLPFYDQNLKNLVSKVKPHCMLAHIRGVDYNEKEIVSDQNVHPFLYENTNIAFAHNGSLADFDSIKYDMLKYTQLPFKTKINGTTDSEGIYALFLSQLKNANAVNSIRDVFSALIDTLKIIQKIRRKHGIHLHSPLNFFISNGEFIVATRCVLDYGQNHVSSPPTYSSLWYTYGEKYGLFENEYKMSAGKKNTSIIIASEPLTDDTTTWLEVPEYTFIGVKIENHEIIINSLDIVL